MGSVKPLAKEDIAFLIFKRLREKGYGLGIMMNRERHESIREQWQMIGSKRRQVFIDLANEITETIS